ncbi:MAG: DegT/DnrJ/EryC1/StrS family aminotransferase [Nanoarchaeota archaeon]|nr:DegT/DnrJ/EryC1/StrS family aminotransferase [Nanoarchaeota archaeon]
MSAEDIKNILKKLTCHPFLEIVLRGNAAITSALSIFPKGSTILIPEEGGWIHYKKAPPQLGLKIVEIKCADAKINLADLREIINSSKPAAFLYQNPGGYFAQQPMKEIYELCNQNKCIVIMDVSGSIGTPLCDGKYADIMVGSFGEGKLVEAKVGGFISCKDKMVWGKIKSNIHILDDENSLQTIHRQVLQLPERIDYLQKVRKKILLDLKKSVVIYPDDTGFVVVVKYSSEKEKNDLMEYCATHKYPYTQCPRYIRVNKLAISIEVKQMS